MWGLGQVISKLAFLTVKQEDCVAWTPKLTDHFYGSSAQKIYDNIFKWYIGNTSSGKEPLNIWAKKTYIDSTLSNLLNTESDVNYYIYSFYY